MDKGEREVNPTDLLGGTLNIFGIQIDLGQLLASPENLKDRMEELRERLKQAGGKETLADDEWRQGGTSITGYIRARGILGDREFHIGTAGKRGTRGTEKPTADLPEVTEPPLDVFDEGREVTIVADVPGVSLDDLELSVEGRTFSLSTRATAPRSYRKEFRLEADVEPDSLQSTCHNGVLEVRLRKRGTGKGERGRS